MNSQNPSQAQPMQQLALEANYYRALSEEVQRRLVGVQNLASEHRAAVEALNALPKSAGDAFLPVGGGAYLKGKVSEGQKVLVEIGARVLLDTPRDHALKILEKRENELKTETERLSVQLQQVLMRLQDLSDAAQALRTGAGQTASTPTNISSAKPIKRPPVRT